MDSKKIRIINKHLTRFSNENIKIRTFESDITVWYVLLHDFSGNSDEFAGGEYLAKMTLPYNYPFSPPKVQMLTPNGVYDINCTAICMGFGDHHKSEYRAIIGAGGVALQLLNIFICHEKLDHGIGLITGRTTNSIKEYANGSKAFNRSKHKNIMKLFDQ